MKNNQFKISENAQVHENFRTWKSGKKWLYASSILALVVSGGAIASSSHGVFADQVLSTSTDKTTGAENTATGRLGSNATAGADNATVASSASDTKSAAQSAATVVGSASDTKSAAQSAAAATASSSSDTKSAAASTADTVASSASDTKGAALSTVTKDNFLQYFSLNGSATYDASQGVVTLTTDNNDLVGNFSLKSKIDMNSSFTLTGQVNLGNKVSSKGGADGIGFAFHDGNTTDIGNAGGNLGIGGLINAVGFKLDTYHNNGRTPQSALPGAQVSPNNSNGYGWSADPSGSQYPQFGGFVTTSNQEIQAIDKNSYQRWWAETDTSSVQKLKDNDLDNNFHDFVASYDGATRVLTISYTETDGNTLTWTKTIDSSSQAMALIVSASTGGAKNLQQFKITSFDFKQAATVNVKYVDTASKQIGQSKVSYPNGAAVNGTYRTTQLDIPGYTFIKMGDGSLSASGTLTQLGDNGTVTYVYTKNPVAGGNVTAKYVDENGNPIADNVVSSGNVGDPYSTTQKDVPGYTFKEVQGNPTGTITDQAQTVTYVYTKNPVTDNNGGTGSNPSGKPGNGTDTGNSSSNQPGNPSQPSNTTNNGVINTSTNTGSKVNNGVVSSPKLPQTGENSSQSQTMSFVGILLAMFGGLLGFLGIKKRRND